MFLTVGKVHEHRKTLYWTNGAKRHAFREACSAGHWESYSGPIDPLLLMTSFLIASLDPPEKGPAWETKEGCVHNSYSHQE